MEQNQNVQIYENYDTKYNVYDDEPEVQEYSPTSATLDSCANGRALVFQIKDPPPPNNRVTAATAPSTVLVIGIIIFAMIAIVLIVIIVLKTRTSGDPNYKVKSRSMSLIRETDRIARGLFFLQVEETRTYTFGSAANTANGPQTNGEFDPLPPGSLGGTLPSTGGGIVSATVIRPKNPSALDNSNNGFYSKSAAPVTATVKKNGGKPVREWYV